MAEYTPCPPEIPEQVVSELPEIPESTSVNCTGDVEYNNCFPDICPTVTEQPEPETIDEGEDTEFSVAGTVTLGEVTFQWQYSDDEGDTWIDITDGGIYDGAQTDTLTLEDVTPESNGYLYRCVLSNMGCDVPSDEVFLFVATFCPTVTLQPTAEEIFYGQDTEFTAAGIVSIGSISYQWQVNDDGGWDDIVDDAVYNGAATDTLTLTFPPEELSGYLYRCVLTKVGCEGVLTDSVALTVGSSCPEITDQPVPQEIFEGQDAEFLIVATVPFGTLTYQWQVNDGGGWDDVVDDAVYSGATTDTLTLTAPPIESTGYLFRCVLSNLGCDVNSDEVELLVEEIPCPEIEVQPEPTTVDEGDDAEFSVVGTVIGGPIYYQWQVDDGGGWDNISDGGIYSGATTDTLTVTAPDYTLSGYLYRCVVSNDGCEVPSDDAELTVEEIPIEIVSSYRSKTSTATLCGFSEYASPSTPPKKYRTQTLSGTNDYCTNFGGGWATNHNDYSGAYTYSGTDCSETNAQNRANYGVAAPQPACQIAPVFNSNSTPGASYDFETFGFPGCFSFTTSQTTRSQIANYGCIGGTNYLWSDAVKTLTVEDTEADAIGRANSLIGYDGLPASVAKMEARGALDFSAPYVFVESQETMTNLVVGRNYQLSIEYGRRVYGTAGAFISYSIVDVFFTAATNPENSVYIDLPNDSGFETNILSVTCVSV